MPAGDGAECGECDADLGVPLASLALLRPRRRSSVWSAVSELQQAGRTVLLLLLLLALERGGGTSRASALGFMGYVVRTREPPQKAPQARLAVGFFCFFFSLLTHSAVWKEMRRASMEQNLQLREKPKPGGFTFGSSNDMTN